MTRGHITRGHPCSLAKDYSIPPIAAPRPLTPSKLPTQPAKHNAACHGGISTRTYKKS